MKKESYKNKTEAELQKALGEKRNALHAFRFNVSGSKVKNIKEARNTKKGIAAILTELNSQKNK